MRCCCSSLTIKGLTGHSSSSKNVESFSNKSLHRRNSSVCGEENYWFPCSLHGGNVPSHHSWVQVGFLSGLSAICLLFVQPTSPLHWFASVWLEDFQFCCISYMREQLLGSLATDILCFMWILSIDSKTFIVERKHSCVADLNKMVVNYSCVLIWMSRGQLWLFI